jgi:predicted esterase
MRVASLLAVAAGALCLSACGASSGAATRRFVAVRANAIATAVHVRDPVYYRYDVAHGAQLVRDRATASYWLASTSPARPKALLVTVHGHNDSASRAYRLWQPYAAKHGLGLVSVEWQTQWGRNANFLDDRATYGMIARAVRAQGTPPGRVLLHGFSQGSHEAFALTALDRAGPRLFAMTIAESGGDGVVGGVVRAFAGTRWALYCAGHDPWPQLSGCPAMRRAKGLLTASGATVTRLLVDPPASHGGFLHNAHDVELTLGDYGRALARG